MIEFNGDDLARAAEGYLYNQTLTRQRTRQIEKLSDSEVTKLAASSQFDLIKEGQVKAADRMGREVAHMVKASQYGPALKALGKSTLESLKRSGTFARTKLHMGGKGLKGLGQSFKQMPTQVGEAVLKDVAPWAIGAYGVKKALD
jgi:hypothetical protein